MNGLSSIVLQTGSSIFLTMYALLSMIAIQMLYEAIWLRRARSVSITTNR